MPWSPWAMQPKWDHFYLGCVTQGGQGKLQYCVAIIMEQVALNKLSLMLKVILHKPQTFSKIIETEIILKSI